MAGPGPAAARPAGYDPQGVPGTPYGMVPPVPAGEAPLLSRQERRRQRVARGVLAFVGALAVLAALGWVFRERLLPNPAGPAAPGVPAIAEPTSAAPAVAGLATPAPTPAPAAANLLATATPTTTPPPEPTTAPIPTPPAVAAEQPAAPAAAEAVPLVDLLPTEEQVPAGLVAVSESERSKQQVVEALGGTEEAAQLLDDWGWEGNAVRDFALPSGVEAEPGATTFINVSVHRFASPQAADDALVYFSDLVANEPGWEEFEIAPVGDAVRALRGAPEGATVVVLYVRDGATMYRIGGSSNTPDGDPTADVVAVAEAVVGRAAATAPRRG